MLTITRVDPGIVPAIGDGINVRRRQMLFQCIRDVDTNQVAGLGQGLQVQP